MMAFTAYICVCGRDTFGALFGFVVRGEFIELLGSRRRPRRHYIGRRCSTMYRHCARVWLLASLNPRSAIHSVVERGGSRDFGQNGIKLD